MILVLSVMMILLLLSAAALSGALHSNTTTFQDQSRTQALAAADAGLNTALARLSAQPFNTTLNQCFTTTWVAQDGSGNCTGQSGSLGSEGSYTYYVSPDMGSWTGHTTSSCTGYPVISTSPTVTVGQRCITSVGTYNGTVERVQERVTDNGGSPYPGGLESLTNILFDTNKPSSAYDGCPGAQHPPCPPVYLNGLFEANGTITLGGQTYPNEDVVNGTLQRGPAATVSLTDPNYTCPASGSSYSTAAYPGYTTVCSIPPAASTSFAWTTSATLSLYKSTATANNDTAINTANPGKSPAPYVASSRTLVISSGNSSAASPIVIPPGTYNFCSISINGGYVQINPIAKGNPGVTIYVDNSTTADGCATGGTDGQVNIPSSGFLNLNTDATTLAINVCGNATGETSACGPWPAATPPCGGAAKCPSGDPSQTIGKVTLNDDLNSTGGPSGNGMTWGELVAPDSYLTTTGNGLRWTGGIVIGNWESNDNDYLSAPPPGTSGQSTESFYPVAYHKCASTYGSDVTAGCY